MQLQLLSSWFLSETFTSHLFCYNIKITATEYHDFIMFSEAIFNMIINFLLYIYYFLPFIYYHYAFFLRFLWTTELLNAFIIAGESSSQSSSKTIGFFFASSNKNLFKSPYGITVCELEKLVFDEFFVFDSYFFILSLHIPFLMYNISHQKRIMLIEHLNSSIIIILFIISYYFLIQSTQVLLWNSQFCQVPFQSAQLI